MKKTFAFLLCSMFGFISQAQQPGEDLSLKGDGSNIVIGVILIIFVGIVVYLVSLDRKLTRLEQQNDK